MRSTPLMAISAGLWLAALPAQAQVVETGQEVRVNAFATRSASVVLYPDTEYQRVVPQLLYPGERSGPLVLRPPGTRRAVTRSRPRPAPVAQPAPPPAEVAAPAPKPAPPTRVASAAPPPKPAPQQQQQANPYLATPDYSNIFGGQSPKPAPQKPPAQVASAAPPAKPAPAKPAPSDAGLVKRSVILFAKDAPDPAEGALGAIKFLATDLNAAMTRPASRIELQAYGGAKGDKGSDARRLSLKRALAIRQVLIDDGVSADRIDVRAMGGADDTGPLDRVDVFVRA